MKRILLSVLMAVCLVPSAEARPPARHQRVTAPIQFEPQAGAKIEVTVATKGIDTPVNIYVTRTQTALKKGIQSRLTNKEDPIFMSAAHFRAMATRKDFTLPRLQDVDAGKSRVTAGDDFIAIRSQDGTTVVKVEWPTTVPPETNLPAATGAAYTELVASVAALKDFPEKMSWDRNRWLLKFSNGESIPLVKDETTRRAVPATPAPTRRLAQGKRRGGAL